MALRSRLARLDGTLSGLSRAPDSAAATGASPAVATAPDGARARVLDDLRARIQAALERSAPKAPPPSVDTVELPFASVETPRGPLHVRVHRLSAAHRTGRAPVACGADADPELLALLALDPGLAHCDPRRALYLDTETTGLAGGTGTVAFLVGLAWWDGGCLVLEQLLVRELGEEAPMLERVRERIQAASLLVTFNGKSFDMPLLRTRFVMARLERPLEPPHLDLLHVARRIHGKRIRQGCRLVCLERDVLGFERLDDVASGDVSACYLHFLRTGDARALLGVIEHNAWDVVAMAALVGLYGEPAGANGSAAGDANRDLSADDLAGVARTLRRAGALDRASAFADLAVIREVCAESLRARAEIAKARGDRARALADFEALAASIDDASVRLELAKIYEHWERAPGRALEWVARGTGEGEHASRRRRERLERKAAKPKPKA